MTNLQNPETDEEVDEFEDELDYLDELMLTVDYDFEDLEGRSWYRP